MAESILMLVLSLALVYAIRIGLRRVFFRATGSLKNDDQHCRCGYSLKNLSIARCPECGRVVGFNATAETLGLTHEELERAQRAKQMRSQEDSARKAHG
jgi:hypothetical protein